MSDNTYVIGKLACPKCREMGNDNSGDNLIRYSDMSAHCFACGYNENGKIVQKENTKLTEAKQKPIITEEEALEIKQQTTSSVEFRGITAETNKFFGVRYEVDFDDDSIVKQYYPCTIGYKLSGYKPRTIPKRFGSSVGNVGMDCELGGQFRFKSATGGSVLIVGGEIDQLSAYQMLWDAQVERGKEHFQAVAVVTPTVGETGCAKQVQKQYQFFDKFDKIVIGFDNDSAGREATDNLIKVLPKGKIHIANWKSKDPNEYLMCGKQKDFVNDFYRAEKYVPAGVLGSNMLYQKVIENAMIPKIPLPPFMHELQRMMAGGMPLGYIVNFGAGSGIGKSSIVNEMIYYWIFNSPHTIGVVSMELDAGQYGEVMLSRHMGKKIALIEDSEEKLDYLESYDVQYGAMNLFQKEDGSSRWHLLDDRDGSLEAVKSVVEELVVSCDCKVIVLDPIQDLLDGLSNEDQAVFMRWQKSIIKSHQITFININHMRKNGAGKDANSAGAFITEEDFAGSSTIFKSAGANILYTRNKYAEDEIEKNTTHAIMSKCRWTGLTGNAGDYYYDNPTHTLHCKETFFLHNPRHDF